MPWVFPFWGCECIYLIYTQTYIKVVKQTMKLIKVKSKTKLQLITRNPLEGTILETFLSQPNILQWKKHNGDKPQGYNFIVTFNPRQLYQTKT